MELVKDIYFNTDKLIENTKIKVSYTGKFYQGNNEKVYLHYGYDKDWNNVTELEMKKTDLGYQAELNLLPGDTLNFCFKNQNDEWDNNFGQNYVFNIQKKSNNTVNTNKENSFIFFGRKFGNKDESQSSNVFWNSNNSDSFIKKVSTVNTSTVVTNIGNNSDSTSVDAFIKNTSGIFQNSTKNAVNPSGSQLQTPTDINGFKIITPSFRNDNVDTPCMNTSIATVPTGINYWTKKIKETVCRFFAYVPKLISGNYKRNVSNEKK